MRAGLGLMSRFPRVAHGRRVAKGQRPCAAATQKQKPKTASMKRQSPGRARRLATPVARVRIGEEGCKHECNGSKRQCKDHDRAPQRLAEVTPHVLVIQLNAPSFASLPRRVA